ncbi:MAG: hypothetical protein GF418_09485, partial [Chitinivibrionales bacterium]|nr:hypothetical protein [Chitinivibrionales bacterium]MBD3395841.1 hypothetical protein [Chitinivibrionales bacterium]
MDRRKVKASKETTDSGIAVVHVSGMVITNIGVTTVDRVVRETVEKADMPKLILNLSDVS